MEPIQISSDLRWDGPGYFPTSSQGLLLIQNGRSEEPLAKAARMAPKIH